MFDPLHQKQGALAQFAVEAIRQHADKADLKESTFCKRQFGDQKLVERIKEGTVSLGKFSRVLQALDVNSDYHLLIENGWTPPEELRSAA